MNFINIQLFVIAMLPLHTTLLSAQTPLAIYLQLEKDTASSVFAQDYCRISYLTNEMDTIISSRRHTQLQARFASSSWKNITLPLNSSDPTLIVSGNDRFLINLLPFFLDDDSLFIQLRTNDFFIELRVSIFAIVNNVAGYNFNSNIAKLHLKANQDDILAFLYLKEHNIDPVSFSWLWN